MIKAIIFDLDNTLIDFMTMKKMSVAGAIRSMQDAGLDISNNKAQKILYALYDKHGMEYQKVFQDFLKQVIGKIDYKILAHAIVGYRKVERGFMQPYPKVKSTLRNLEKRGIRLAILTDAPRMRAWLRLAEMEISDYFEFVLTYDDTKVKKPDKKAFVKMLNKLKLNPEEVLMVGDSLDKDIKGAKSMGMKTCYAKYGDVGVSNDKIKADYVLKSVEDLLGIVVE
jgi:HAD superfamily hydrolase (TIGR02253 family)